MTRSRAVTELAVFLSIFLDGYVDSGSHHDTLRNTCFSGKSLQCLCLGGSNVGH